MQKDKRFAPRPVMDPERALGRTLPASLDAERAVLAAVLFNDQVLAQIAEIVVAQDFYHNPHKIIFKQWLIYLLRKCVLI